MGAGVVLAGGTGARMGGVDKARVRWRERRLLEHVLDAFAGVDPVAVVGAPVADLALPGSERVRFVREDPPGGGPAAGLLAGLDAVVGPTGPGRPVAVVAVDMPGVEADTLARLAEAARGRDGAVLLGRGGRRQLAMVLDPDRLRAARPEGPAHGLPVHRLLAGLDLVEVPARGDEGADVDTWADLDALARVPVEPVGPDDWQRWARLRLEALELAPAAYGSRLADWVDADEARWRERLRAPGALFLARVDAAGPDAGMAAVQPDDAGRWWLVSMYVAPTARGRGVADALVGAGATHVRRSGGTALRLHVEPGNERARATYERLGFTAVDEADRAAHDDGIEMLRTLSAPVSS